MTNTNGLMSDLINPSTTTNSAIIIKNYTGTPDDVGGIYQADAIKMAAQGYSPAMQSWIPSNWKTSQFLLALLLCLIIVGTIILVYMLIIKPSHGTLCVTYKKDAASEYRKVPEVRQDKQSTDKDSTPHFI
ncbi:MAG: hypothetical protein K2Q32_08930 [Alphaproteobacteria bacterium]|nr:hypothetical protein [Alphaproteobacteria bacterium]